MGKRELFLKTFIYDHILELGSCKGGLNVCSVWLLFVVKKESKED